MTGQERADLAIAIELIHNLDQAVQAGFTAVRAEQAQQFTVLDTRLRNAETLLSNDKAVEADRKLAETVALATQERQRITKRWVVGTVISILAGGGGIVAVATAIYTALHH